MSDLRVRMFGCFSARCDGKELAGLGPGKVQELFCYLLLHRDRAITRELLASLLWEHATTSQGRAYLRRALWKLQSILRRQCGVEPGEIFFAETDSLQCNPQLEVWVDVESFERAYRRVEGVPGQDLDEEQIDGILQATSFYDGDLLESYYQDWCLHARDRYRNLHLVMLDKATVYFEHRGRYEVAFSFAERSLAIDRARERTHRQLMRLRYVSGDRTGALHQYTLCREALREDLAVDPSRSTEHLLEQIRTGRLASAPRAPRSAGIAPAAAPQEGASPPPERAPQESAPPESAPQEGAPPSREGLPKAGVLAGGRIQEQLEELRRALESLAAAQQNVRRQVDAIEQSLR